MGKVVKFPGSDDESKGNGEENKKQSTETHALSQEEFVSYLEPLKEGLLKLYPSQVKEVVGVAGFGEERGKEAFLMGILMWEHFNNPQPIASTFLATFIDKKLDKISFLEAKRNYHDWKLMIDTYQDRFNTKEMFEKLQELRKQFFGD